MVSLQEGKISKVAKGFPAELQAEGKVELDSK